MISNYLRCRTGDILRMYMYTCEQQFCSGIRTDPCHSCRAHLHHGHASNATSHDLCLCWSTPFSTETASLRLKRYQSTMKLLLAASVQIWALAASVSAVAKRSDDPRPNVLFMMADQLRHDVNGYDKLLFSDSKILNTFWCCWYVSIVRPNHQVHALFRIIPRNLCMCAFLQREHHFFSDAWQICLFTLVAHHTDFYYQLFGFKCRPFLHDSISCHTRESPRVCDNYCCLHYK